MWSPFPFKYLGLLEGENPKNEKTWDPQVSLVTKRLASRRNEFVSLGGGVVLLNLVLNSIPMLFYVL